MSEEQEQESGRAIIDEVGKLCEDHEIELALFIALNPKTGDAMMWYKGREMPAAKLAAGFVKLVKNKLLKELEF